MSTVPAVTAAATARRPKVVPWFLATLVVLHLLAPLAFLPYAFSWWGLASLLVANPAWIMVVSRAARNARWCSWLVRGCLRRAWCGCIAQGLASIRAA